jgi:hypothetical protein
MPTIKDRTLSVKDAAELRDGDLTQKPKED